MDFYSLSKKDIKKIKETMKELIIPETSREKDVVDVSDIPGAEPGARDNREAPLALLCKIC